MCQEAVWQFRKFKMNIGAKDKLISSTLIILLSALIVYAAAPVINPWVADINMNEDDATLPYDLSDNGADISDPEEDPLSYSVTSNSTGVVCGVQNPSVDVIDISLETNWNGVASCEVTIQDNETSPNSVSDNLTIIVAPVNDEPTISIPDQTLAYNTRKTLNVSSYAEDIDGDDLDFSIVNMVGGVTCEITQDNILNMTPDYEYSGTTRCTVSVSDGNDDNEASVDITVQEGDVGMEAPSEVLFDSASRNVTLETSFTISNTGEINLTDIVIETDADDEYNVSFNHTGDEPIDILEPGESNIVYVKAFIPANTAGEEITMGNIIITSNKVNKTFPLKADVRSKLDLDKLEITVGTETETDTRDEETIDKTAEPGMSVKFSMKIKNNFPSDDDSIKINDISVDVTILDINDGEDLEFDSGEFDLEADTHRWENAEFTVPLAVEDDKYEVIIEASGKDENGVRHSFKRTLYLKVDKSSHDTRIISYELEDESIKCGEETILKVKAINVGTTDEDESVLVVKSDELDIMLTQRFELSSIVGDDESIYEKLFLVEIPQDAESGTHRIVIELYHSNDVLDDFKTINLEVTDCGEEEETEEEQDEQEEEEQSELLEGINETQQELSAENVSRDNVTEVEHKSVFSKPGYLIVLLIINAALLIGVIFAVKFLFKKH